MKVTVTSNKVTVEIERLKESRSSKSGKTTTIATTSGFIPIGEQLDGRDLLINLTIGMRN